LVEISQLIDTKVYIREDGTVDLYTAKGFALVLGEEFKRVEFSTDTANNPVLKVSGVDITQEFNNGIIGGYLKGIDYIDKTMDALNTFTTEFATQINNQHEAGFDLNGNTGISLFKADNGASVIDASNIALNFEDPTMVAAALDVNNLNGDNTNIKALIALKDQTFSNLDNLSFSEFYNTKIVTAIGSELEHTKDLRESSDFVLQSIDEKMKDLSSVNMDEELLNLTRYQRAYEAASKVVSVTDELIQTILNMVG